MLADIHVTDENQFVQSSFFGNILLTLLLLAIGKWAEGNFQKRNVVGEEYVFNIDED